MLKARFSTLDRWGFETKFTIGVKATWTSPQIQAITDALDAVLLGSDVRSEVEETNIVDPGGQAPAAGAQADILKTWSFILYGAAGIEQLLIGTADWSLLEDDRFDLDLTTGPGLALRDALLDGFRFPDGTTATGILDDRARAVNLNLETFLDREVLPVRPIFSMTAARIGSNQTIASATHTQVAFTTIDQLPPDFVTYASNKWTIQRPGRVLIAGNLYYASHATGFRQFRVIVNGVVQYVARVNPTTGIDTPVTGSFAPMLNAGDEIEFQTYQSSGVNLDLVYSVGSPYNNSFSLIGF